MKTPVYIFIFLLVTAVPGSSTVTDGSSGYYL